MLAIATWLWITVLFANFAEAIAEGHGKAQADSLKQSRTTVVAHKLSNPSDRSATAVSATDLQIGDVVIVKAGETFFVPEGLVHDGINTGSGKAKVLATYVVEKGKPVATPAK